MASVRKAGSSASGSRLTRQQSAVSRISADSVESPRQSAKHSSRRSLKSTPTSDSLNAGTVGSNKYEDSRGRDLERELIRQLAGTLSECSRQRLRAIRMTMRSNGSGEARITFKEVLTVLTDNHIKVTPRVHQIIHELYEDSFGIDYERMWRSLVLGHTDSGRDSVVASNKCASEDLNSSGNYQGRVEKDKDLVNRIGEQLTRYREPYDLDDVKEEFQSKDKDKGGKIDKKDIDEVVSSCHLPLYGALLTALIKRCDDENNGEISWPEMVNFLNQGKNHAIKNGLMTKDDFAKLHVQRKEVKQEAAAKKAEMLDTERKLVDKLKLLKKVESVEKAEVEKRPDALSKEIVQAAFKNTVLNNQDRASPIMESTEVLNLKASLKGKSGFLTSMKSLLKGKKKDDLNDGMVSPLIPVSSSPNEMDNLTEVTIVSENSSDKSNKSTSPPNGVTLHIKASNVDNTVKQVLQGQVTASSSVIGKSDQTGQKQNGNTKLVENQVHASPGKLSVDLNGKKITFKVPEHFDANVVNTDPPQERLQLDWIYGYRGHDTRSNIHVLNTGEVMYCVGTVVVLYSIEQHKQRHYREHTQEIRSLALHPNKNTVASGQSGAVSVGVSKKKENIEAHVRVWRSDTLQTLYVLGSDMFYKSVISLAFSATETWLCAVDDSPEHVISVWDISSGKIVTKVALGVDFICGVEFQPRDPSTVVVIGKEHLGWWAIQKDETGKKSLELVRRSEYQTYLKPRYVTALWHNDKDDLITGDSNGTVYVWGHGGNIITNIIKHAHSSPVLCVTVTRGHVITGGKDSAIKCWQWDKNMEMVGSLEIEKNECGVRTLVVHKGKLLIGTVNSSIMIAVLAEAGIRNPFEGIVLNETSLTHGHVADITGLCVPPDSDGPSVMLTAGLDGSLCAYDTDKHIPLWKYTDKMYKISCFDCNFNGTVFALGSVDNNVQLLSVFKGDDGKLHFEEEFCLNISNQSVVETTKLTVVRLAPDNSMVAVGHSKGYVSVIGLVETENADEFIWDVIAIQKCHKSSVTGIDWSVDKFNDQYLIRSSSEENDFAFWNGNTLESSTINTSALKWASASCKMLYSTVGVYFSKQASEADVSVIGVNPKQTLVAMGDSRGYVSLFRYPCCKKGAFSHTYRAHQRVGCLHFTQQSTACVTSGKDDMTVMQWKVI